MTTLKLFGEPPAGGEHGALSGLTDDDHAQYAQLGGRAGGQALRGGQGAGETLTLESTAHASKGKVVIPDTLKLSGLVIADAGDTPRITLASSSPHTYVQGDTRLDRARIGPAALGSDRIVQLKPTVAGTTVIMEVSPDNFATLDGSNQSVTALFGLATAIGSGTGATLHGLQYKVGRGNATLGLSKLTAILAGVQSSFPGTGSTGDAYLIEGTFNWGGSSIPSNTYGLSIPPLTRGTNRYGVRIGDQSWNLVAGEVAYGIQMDQFDMSAQGTQWPFRYGDVGGALLFGVMRDGTLRLPVFSDASRPAASAAGQGAVIFNSTDNGINVSDGADWRMPIGGWIPT